MNFTAVKALFFSFQILITHHSSTCRSHQALEKRAGTAEDVVRALPWSPQGPQGSSPVPKVLLVGRAEEVLGEAGLRGLCFFFFSAVL